MALFNIPVTDWGNENSSISIPVADAESDANLTTLFGAFDGVCLGNFGQSTLNIHTPKDAGPGGASTDKLAQRKLKWLCRYHDNVTLEKLTLEVACPDVQLLTGNTDFADLAAGAGLAYKTQFDLHVRSRRTGNQCTLDSMQLVGRKLNRTS